MELGERGSILEVLGLGNLHGSGPERDRLRYGGLRHVEGVRLPAPLLPKLTSRVNVSF